MTEKMIRFLCIALAGMMALAAMTMTADAQELPMTDEEFIRMIRPSAEQGDANDQYILGLSYYKGEGVPHNKSEAAKWFRLAAEQGDTAAQFRLGGMYDFGEGVPENKAEAIKWYRRAAEQGDAAAQFSLGGMYDFGKGVPENKAEAIKWYRRAAEHMEKNDNVTKETIGELLYLNLGGKYHRGIGVPQDYAEAEKWYLRLAAHGKKFHGDGSYAYLQLGWLHEDKKDYAEAIKWFGLSAKGGDNVAQHTLGSIYYEGKHIPQNFYKAYIWLSLAAANGISDAMKARDDAAKLLSPADLSAAQKETARRHVEITAQRDKENDTQ